MSSTTRAKPAFWLSLPIVFRRTLALVVATSVAATSSGCATIFSGSMVAVNVSCNVPGASIAVDGVPSSTGLVALKKRRNSHRITATAPGYSTASERVEFEFSPLWFLADVFFGGVIIGALIDDLTDCGRVTRTESVQLILVPKGAVPDPPGAPGPNPVAPSESSPAAASFCAYCGARFTLGDAKFCPSCGKAR